MCMQPEQPIQPQTEDTKPKEEEGTLYELKRSAHHPIIVHARRHKGEKTSYFTMP